MNILQFIASLGWEEGELNRRIDALDQEYGVDSSYDGSMLLTDEEYSQYMKQKPTPVNITLSDLT